MKPKISEVATDEAQRQEMIENIRLLSDKLAVMARQGVPVEVRDSCLNCAYWLDKWLREDKE